MKEKIIKLAQQEVVLLVAGFLAVISCFFVKPDSQYISYIDWRTLILLFCLMAVMAGIKELGIFRLICEALLDKVKTQMGVALILVGICFLGSMLITNDVALITFIPFGILMLKTAGMDQSVCLTVTLMTIAANLGSMLTPIGNPQNLYLYSISGMTLLQFIKIMFPYSLVAAVMLLLIILITYRKTEVYTRIQEEKNKIKNKKVVLYLIMFLICLSCVMKLISAEILLLIIFVAVFVENRKLFLKIDYGLLATFIAFFIFIGNVGRIPLFHALISDLVTGHEEVAAIAASQLISNVPASLLLSGFTHRWEALIVGVNLGGLGTMIASMASLISYKQIVLNYPGKKLKYLAVFTVWNIGFLIILFSLGTI